MQRSSALSEFIESIRAALHGASTPALETADRVFARLDRPPRAGSTNTAAKTAGDTLSARAPQTTSVATPRITPIASGNHNAVNFLTPALHTARTAPSTARVATAFAALAPALTWLQRPGSEADSQFHAGHANCLIVGPGGLEARDDVRVGASLLAPNVRYPDHSHPPEEVYVVLSDGEWFGTAAGWYRPGVGGIVHHKPSVLHAMRSGETPLLAVWCLPL
ncbi:MAG: hypothetical protein ACI9W2_004193 [Gammaproteobacteria bacterium]|jgi:hypothetical protein